MIATKGQAAPEVERTYARARVLCQLLPLPPRLQLLMMTLLLLMLALLLLALLGRAPRRPQPANGASIRT